MTIIRMLSDAKQSFVNAWRVYVLIYFLLLFKVGFFFQENLSAITSTLFILLLLWYKNNRINHDKGRVGLKVMSAILFFKHLTYLVFGFPGMTEYFASIVNDITAILFVSCISYPTFFRNYSNLLFIICCASNICWVLITLGIPIPSYAPVLTNSHGVSVYFLGLANVWANVYGVASRRMMGIFWEPGAFQVFIIFAFVIDLYRNHSKNTLLWRLLVYSFAIFSTYSTTGFLSLAFAWALYFIKVGNRYAFITLSLFSVFLYYLVVYLQSSADSYLAWAMFGKLQGAHDVMMYGDAGDGSTSTRVQSVIEPLSMFVESPIFGIGQAGKDTIAKATGHGMLTCTPINYIAIYGIFCAIICYRGFLRLLNLKYKSKLESIVLIVLVIVCTMSEALAFNPVLSVFMLYGYLRTPTKDEFADTYYSIANRT